MRTFKGLENIHSVIDMHVAEWRKEQGEPEENISELSLEENVRRRLTSSMNPNTGKFSADRFLGAKPMQQKAKTVDTAEQEEEQEAEVEIKSVIKHQDGKPHSWLYNEVVKAINDAKGNGKNTKVVAIFIPVIQNGKEFEDLPVDESVTLPPVDEDAVKIEDLAAVIDEHEEQTEAAEADEQEIVTEQEQESQEEQGETNGADFDLLPEGPGDNDEELVDAFQTMEEKLDESLQEEQEQETLTEDPVVEEEVSELVLPEINEQEQPEDTQTEELIEPELEQEPEEENPEPVVGIDEVPDETESVGEVMTFTEIDSESNEIENEEANNLEDVEIINESESEEEPKLLPLPDPLDDDEVFEDEDTELEDPLAASNRINELSGEVITLEEDESENIDDDNDRITL